MPVLAYSETNNETLSLEIGKHSLEITPDEARQLHALLSKWLKAQPEPENESCQ